MRIPFSERAIGMGLNSQEYKGLYSYSDGYSEIIYRQLATLMGENTEERHDTDGITTPIIALYTRHAESQTDYLYCGPVSEFYQFIGNDVLNESVRASVQEVGMPILTENTILSYDLTRMRNELIIQSSQEVANVGDVLPVMVVQNSYNGTKAASLSFGIATHVNSERVVFAFSLGEMRQVHIANSNTEMTSAVASYMQVFTGNLVDMISNSFNSRLTEVQMLGTLDVIEKIGKRRREEISKLLAEMNPVSEGEGLILPSAWQMFLAIVRYSSFEPNLNIKKMLENAAESVLVIPERMYNVLEKLENT